MSDLQISADETKMCNGMLDKLTLKSLHLMEDKIRFEVEAEKRIKEGNFHLAKSRYVTGHNSVSALNLPLDSPNGFSASKILDRNVDDFGEPSLSLETSNEKDTVNPIKWFGVLVPQNLHKAQTMFNGALLYLVDCANVRLKLDQTLDIIEHVKVFLNSNMEKK